MSKPSLTVLWKNKIVFFKGTVKELSKQIENIKQQHNDRSTKN